MSLVAARIIAPDTAHWSRWLDDAVSADPRRREAGRAMHGKLIDQGKVPLLSFHHLEELLCVESAESARQRVAYLQSLPLIAWTRMPGESNGVGAIIDILAAEVVAITEGCSSALEVRDQVRARLMRTGSGAEAIGPDGWVWEMARLAMLNRRPHIGMVAALSDRDALDPKLTVGEFLAKNQNTPEDRERALAHKHAEKYREARESDPKRSHAEALAMADAFVARMRTLLPPGQIDLKQLLVTTYATQHVDPEDVRDDATFGALSELGILRSQLHIAAEKTSLSFERIKYIDSNLLPSWLISRALRAHGQKRVERPGSNVHDEHLAVLAAYADTLYVDKRTHEDFTRVLRKAPPVAALVQDVRKASQYPNLLD
ncbi:hypothetical protein [Sphingomonas kyeonggiensis]|uniref:Uncharacterized protein n=1 Tax=Sphingomonas kyeonggiensis TaxID=1268553 RepID=A0A7W6JS47_9SPHN|nr:hypothetical protein [Sphingomonas kyeonggiensis]MBB4097457.1 hypothetical protein [Sphingomonas kyeonggiensis]